MLVQQSWIGGSGLSPSDFTIVIRSAKSDDTRDPRSETCTEFKRVSFSKCDDSGFLHDILRISAISHAAGSHEPKPSVDRLELFCELLPFHILDAKLVFLSST